MTVVGMGVALNVVRGIGQPLEHAWPYLSNLPDDQESWQAPEFDGTFFKRNYELLKIAIDQVFQSLDSGLPVIMTFYLSDAFFSNWDNNGIIDETYPPDRGLTHAVVVRSGI